jgi:carboxyl-terminal processing protease
MKKYILSLFIVFPILGIAQQAKQDAFQQKAMLLKRFMDKNHYKPLQWNDSSSTMLYNKWINDLDDEKLFFIQKDITLLDAYKTNLDDELNGKSWKFFNTSIDIYRTRLQKVDSIVQAYLSQPIDITKADNFVWPSTNFAPNEQELTKRWQRYLKWQLLDKVMDKIVETGNTINNIPPANFVKLEQEERLRIKKREGSYIKALMNTAALFLSDKQDEYLNTIAWCYDPHSNYFNTKEKNEFEAEVSAMEYSAGLSFNENEKGDKVINFLQPGGSAWRSGQLHKGDVLIKIKANNIEKEVADLSLNDVSNLLKSANSSDVEVTIKTAAGEIKTIKLIQEKITSEEGIVKSFIIKADKNIGYINLPGFYSREEEGEAELKYDGCANDVSKEIIKLRKDNVAGLILDLRNNGGGSMWEAMQLAGIFIDAGPIASVKEKTGKVTFLKDPNRGTIYDGPMIVLINGQSASASEFLSATLQDYNRALIVGGATYGKGTAQVVVPLDTNTADRNKQYEDFVKITERKFYRVNGSTVQWKGVEPDVPLPDLYEDISFKEKGNQSALVPDMSKLGNYQLLPTLPIVDLKLKSEARVKSSPFFNQKIAFIKQIQVYKNGATIPLQWTTFMAYYKKQQKEMALFDEEKLASAKLNVVENNFYDKEKYTTASKQTKEINDTYIKNIVADNTLAEACNILNDWLKK